MNTKNIIYNSIFIEIQRLQMYVYLKYLISRATKINLGNVQDAT